MLRLCLIFNKVVVNTTPNPAISDTKTCVNALNKDPKRHLYLQQPRLECRFESSHAIYFTKTKFSTRCYGCKH